MPGAYISAPCALPPASVTWRSDPSVKARCRRVSARVRIHRRPPPCRARAAGTSLADGDVVGRGRKRHGGGIAMHEIDPVGHADACGGQRAASTRDSVKSNPVTRHPVRCATQRRPPCRCTSRTWCPLRMPALDPARRPPRCRRSGLVEILEPLLGERRRRPERRQLGGISSSLMGCVS